MFAPHYRPVEDSPQSEAPARVTSARQLPGRNMCVRTPLGPQSGGRTQFVRLTLNISLFHMVSNVSSAKIFKILANFTTSWVDNSYPL